MPRTRGVCSPCHLERHRPLPILSNCLSLVASHSVALASQGASDGVVCAASREDLLAHKLKVMFQRIEAKDYSDVAALLRSGVPLETGLASAATLFGPNFQPALSLKALVYFSGGNLAILPATDRATLTAAVSAVNLRAGLPAGPRLSSSLQAR